MSNQLLLNITDLQVGFSTDQGYVNAVNGVSFSLEKGETLGIVGESGSGKSVTALSIMGLLPSNGNIRSGQAQYHGRGGETVDLFTLPEKHLRRRRGNEIAMVFQEPMSSLNPVLTCGEQVVESIILHKENDRSMARSRACAMFEKVKLQDPERIYRAYPHELSGGQRQRVMIAMAISCDPSLLIADEPTSALDVTVQHSILELINELKNEWGGTSIFISHDLGVIAAVADRVLVMKKGQVVESGKVADVLQQPEHPYTARLVEDFRGRKKQEEMTGDSGLPLLKVTGLKTWFPASRKWLGSSKNYIKAVDDVSLEVYEGETLGIVGESGSGKTTLGRTILHLQTASGGEVVYDGQHLTAVKDEDWKPFRKELQIIFQDPFSSLDPKQAIGPAIVEPMTVHGLYASETNRREQALLLLEQVGLEAGHFWRFPHEFSGGQRQRICIARALAVQPRLIICDECVSALDVTVQAQILALLKSLQKEHKLTYLFISHDLGVVRQISDRIVVMKDGRIVETGKTEEVFNHPEEAYTRALLDAIPKY